jgi:hypothetical protein
VRFGGRATLVKVALVSVIAAIVIFAALLWYRMPPEFNEAPDIASCAGLYRHARTANDTLHIDRQYPPHVEADQPARLTCGMLRVSFPKYFQPEQR